MSATAFWYTVTHDPGIWGAEKQVFYAYSSPRVETIECGKNALTVRGPGYQRDIDYASLEHLRRAPIQLYRDEPLTSSGKSPLRRSNIRWGLFLILAVVAWTILRWKRHPVAA